MGVSPVPSCRVSAVAVITSRLVRSHFPSATGTPVSPPCLCSRRTNFGLLGQRRERCTDKEGTYDIWTIRAAALADANALPPIEQSAGARFATIQELAWLADGDYPSLPIWNPIRTGGHFASPGQLLGAVEFLQCRFRLECLGLASEGLRAKHANRRIGAREFRPFAAAVSGKTGCDVGRDAGVCPPISAHKKIEPPALGHAGRLPDAALHWSLTALGKIQSLRGPSI
jgi:hypothetical protein